jgi:hypothetical protein
MPLCKTSDSDVSKETIAEWKVEFEKQIEFVVVESDEINEAVLDFITNENVDVLTMLIYKRGFFKGLFNLAILKSHIQNFTSQF